MEGNARLAQGCEEYQRLLENGGARVIIEPSVGVGSTVRKGLSS
jgi:hypothetical protein